MIAVEVTKNGFARLVPDGAEWTPEGDLDFERSGLLPDMQSIRFEFDRIVLTLANSLPGQRRPRSEISRSILAFGQFGMLGRSIVN